MTLAPNFLTASETIALVASGKLTVTQIAEAHLERYDDRDGQVKAWAWVDRDLVLTQAKVLDALPKEKRGPLHGAVIGVKDMINTKDMPTQHYSPIYKGSRPGVDAAPVAVLRAAGALIFGKTHTTMFATITQGTPAGNPYDVTHTPGGSSSGSGAAVGDWQCQIALGTQTKGSTLRPGSYNGVFAMKPTYGSISREGLKHCVNHFDTLGLFTRSITDLTLLLSVFNVTDDVPVPSIPKPLSECRFGYVKTDQWDIGAGVAPALSHAWEESKKLLVTAGAKVEEIQLPEEFNNISNITHGEIMSSECGVTFLPEYRIASDLLVPELRGYVENVKGVTKKQLLAAYDKLALLRPKLDAICADYDALITPSAPDVAPAGLESTGDPRFQAMWTALHVPCVNVPGFAGDNGLPIGLALVAPRYEDERLLSISRSVAQVWIEADVDKLIKIPAPQGAKHCIV